MRTIAAAAALLIATAAPAAEFRTGQPVMGTILQVTVIAEDTTTARRVAEAGMAEAKRWDDMLTTWRPEGELARLNDAAGKGDVAVSPGLHSALEEMLVLIDRTGGAFNPAVGSMVSFWQTGQRATPPLGQTHFRSSLRMGIVTANLAKGTRLDAGAIGKGMALDAIALLLRGYGIEAAFLDFGGSSHLAIGAPPDSPEGWVVAITGLETGSLRGTIPLRNGALSTSWTRPVVAADGPIIDPRVGRPVTEQRVVTVWHPNATDADAWSTALIVLGRDGIEQAQSAGVEVFLEDTEGVARTDGFPLQPF